MTPTRRDSQPTAAEKTELVLCLLGGQSISSLSRESGLPRKQLSVWRQRFLAGGEAWLESRPNPAQTERLRTSVEELTRRVASLEGENELLARRVHALDETHSGQRFAHPYCSLAYAVAQEEPGSEALPVPAWGTHLLVRQGPGGRRLAVGGRPFASLDPNSDLTAGLDQLREEGVTSVSLVTDPMWSPEQADLEAAFDVCRRFKQTYLVDRYSYRAKISKRHRNRINKARHGAELREISFADHLDTWMELYRHNVANRQIPQPFPESYFERLGELAALRTFAVLVDGEIVTITTWVRHRDIFYFHDAASSRQGHAVSASYVAFAHVVDAIEECRYVFFGGAAEFFDDPLDGLARFKRGFANRSNLSYLCSAILNPKPAAAALSSSSSPQ